jgi:hypothetical protein
MAIGRKGADDARPRAALLNESAQEAAAQFVEFVAQNHQVRAPATYTIQELSGGRDRFDMETPFPEALSKRKTPGKFPVGE